MERIRVGERAAQFSVRRRRRRRASIRRLERAFQNLHARAKSRNLRRVRRLGRPVRATLRVSRFFALFSPPLLASKLAPARLLSPRRLRVSRSAARRVDQSFWRLLFKKNPHARRRFASSVASFTSSSTPTPTARPTRTPTRTATRAFT